ncbi:MAG TPA: NAD(P)/FAD-dependent oxidoreductase [Solirubrobacteraceae bacterium]|nr:NAD(P)/FAD-dependent oxidoreductase [Solirubrobacteraceae bacterium]
MAPEHVDVLIVGAGLSGVGAACHLRSACPEKSFAIVEARAASGGTWDLFRYPGVRSDSDMFTLGYEFAPWREARAIADGPSILRYIRDTAREHGVDQMIRYNRRVVSASFNTSDASWAVEIEHTDSGEREQLSCSLLFANTGYYRYDEGYTPKIPGQERFRGQIIHPQHWPEDLDYAGKRVVVIGSGATAVTLVPAMAERAAHVTMLQRSPSYVLSLPNDDPVARLARRALPSRASYALVRWKNVALATLLYEACRAAPRLMTRLLRGGVRKALPDGYDVDTHFKPTYEPWDQRLCLVPDGDLFEAISNGSASVETDKIETFTERGLQLRSGRQLEADVVVTATGLNLLMLGGMAISVDDQRIDLSETVGYKAMMLSGVPNLVFTVGYTNASWTLKADLVANYVCRLLAYMDEHGYRVFTPLAPGPATRLGPLLDLKSGYVKRSLDELPKQGDRMPWRLHQNYPRDVRIMRYGPIQDDGIVFSGGPGQPDSEPQAPDLVAA